MHAPEPGRPMHGLARGQLLHLASVPTFEETMMTEIDGKGAFTIVKPMRGDIDPERDGGQ